MGNSNKLNFQQAKVLEILSDESMKPPPTNTTVKECLERFPKPFQVFMDAGFLCVGCPTEAFHTLDDVAREYQLDLNQLLKQIRQAIEVAK